MADPRLHLAHGKHGMNEGRDEDADGQLARLVAKKVLHDARRELAHGQLHHHHRDGQHEGREGHH